MKKQFRYTALIQSIPDIRNDMHELLKEWKLPSGELKQLLLIVEELFSNICRYAFDDPGSAFVKISLIHEDQYLTITISDQGRPFNPLEYDPEELDDPIAVRDGGMGILLIRAFAEKMEYQRSGETNILMIRKAIFL